MFENLTLFALAGFYLLRLRVLLLFFQQEEYDSLRFFKYIFNKNRLIDKKLSGCLILLMGATYFFPWVKVGFFFLLAFFAWKENTFLKSAKKKVVFTRRASCLYGVSALLAFFLGAQIEKSLPVLMTCFLIIQFLPFLMIVANVVLFPLEQHIRNKYIRLAKKKIREVNPVVIAVTGSYGKTSVKHILGHILSAGAPAYWTPGSINTMMGLCRMIQTGLTASHKYFVAEVGAYRKGSIRKVCSLLDPQFGIVTAIGHAHYERFKTQEAIAEAKFELAPFVQKNGGFVIVNTLQTEEKFIPTEYESSLIRFGRPQDKEDFISDICQTKEGLSFTFHKGEESVPLFAPIFGLHHAQNIGLAVEAALRLGMPMGTIRAALKTLPQITHRLEVKPQGHRTIIDDAYNSNPTGFKAALELLGTLKTKRGILITPGMVELGSLHESAHEEAGRLAGLYADIVLLVKAQRIPSFIKGFQKTAPSSALLLEMTSFQAAYDWLQKNEQEGDVVLMENDLPDLYESKFSL
jgi:UDP-N-acetylmuramoyl-tripeptide--D-alanyl-D-alanine ligase